MPDKFYNKIPNYVGMMNKFETIPNNIFKKFIAGKTVLNRAVFAFSYGNIDKSDTVLYVGGFHSQESLTVLLLYKFIEDLCSIFNSEENKYKNILKQKSFIIIPCINIDGQDLVANGFKSAGNLENFIRKISNNDLSNWNANLNGVDINHNFDAGFSELKKLEIQQKITEPSPRQYGGAYAFSEPESIILRNICDNYPISRVIAFHSQGEEIYYKYGDNTPDESLILAEKFSESCKYKVCHPEGMASHGGFKDWFIEKKQKAGFTFEIGKGKNPLPISDFEKIYANLFETLILGITL